VIIINKGKIVLDKSKPDGTKRKLLSSKKIKSLGLNFLIDLENGIKNVYNNLDFYKYK